MAEAATITTVPAMPDTRLMDNRALRSTNVMKPAVLFPTVDQVHVSNKMMDLSELAMLVTEIHPTKTVNIV